MKLIFRIFGVLLLAVVVFLVAGIAATWAPDKAVQELSKRWAEAPSQFIEVSGMQVHLRDQGPRDDPHPIVLLHGTSASLHTWDAWTAQLMDTRRVIRFDLPGFGLTGPDPRDDYSMGAYVRFVSAMLDKLGVTSCVLAGNSLGGQIAWETALSDPSRVDRLILVDAAGYAFTPKSIPIGFQLARMPGAGVVLESILPRGVIQSSLHNVYGDASKVTPALVDRYYDMALRAGNRHALGLRFKQLLAIDPQRIKSLKVPTLILWGAQDNLIPVENAKLFERDIAGSTLTVFGSLGHVPHEEDPMQTIVPVKAFLAPR